MNQAYHVEALAPDQRGEPARIVQRVSMRSDSMDPVERRAVRLLQRSQTTSWQAGPVEAVRVVDGAGTEVFRWSVWDELSRPGGR